MLPGISLGFDARMSRGSISIFVVLRAVGGEDWDMNRETGSVL